LTDCINSELRLLATTLPAGEPASWLLAMRAAYLSGSVPTVCNRFAGLRAHYGIEWRILDTGTLLVPDPGSTGRTAKSTLFEQQQVLEFEEEKRNGYSSVAKELLVRFASYCETRLAALCALCAHCLSVCPCARSLLDNPSRIALRRSLAWSCCLCLCHLFGLASYLATSPKRLVVGFL
jgi:hypothetical protein